MILPLLAELRFPAWDPVAISLGPLSIRWYGLGYLAGFLVAGWILDRLGRDGFVPLTKHSVSDLIGWLVVGVLVGARLGYALVYDRSLFSRPLDLVQVWRGGLSFHGGLAGVIVMTAIFAKRRGIQWRRLVDGLSLCIPFGIFFVRCANFINGELYGRIAPESVPWAMRFPTDPLARALSPDLARAGSLRWHEAYEHLVQSGAWQQLAPNIPLRHPSQLYEALVEGVLMGLVLWLVYRKRKDGLRPGSYTALFLTWYAVGRFLVEFTRQPDAQLGFVLGPLSMGQLLSFILIGTAALIYWWPRKSQQNP